MVSFQPCVCLPAFSTKQQEKATRNADETRATMYHEHKRNSFAGEENIANGTVCPHHLPNSTKQQRAREKRF